MTLALVTNDDGIESPGLVTLAAAAVDAGLEVLVAAPSWDSSGASAALTGVQEDGRLRADHGRWAEPDVPTVSIEAAPAMITVAALRGGLGRVPDLVLSGINRGRNTGAAVLHSGTVGAALTAANLGVPALAVSIDSDEPQHWATAGVHACRAVRWLVDAAPVTAINLNVPDLPAGEVRGLACAPLARVGAVQTQVTDTGEGYLHVQYEEAGPPRPGTDAALLAEGWAVVTALAPVGLDTGTDLAELVDERFGPAPAGGPAAD